MHELCLMGKRRFGRRFLGQAIRCQLRAHSSFRSLLKMTARLGVECCRGLIQK